MTRRAQISPSAADAKPAAPPPEDLSDGLPCHKWAKVLHAKGAGPLVSRKRLRDAAYNPRQIDLPAKVKLKNALRHFGLVEAVVWNERTGHLVSGHQRLKVMDEEHGSQDYSVPASIRSLSEDDERVLNVELNNPGSQGYYDLEKLNDLIVATPTFDAEMAGFDTTLLLQDLKLSPNFDAKKLTHVFGDPDAPDDAAADALKIAEMKASKEDHKQVARGLTGEGFFLQLVWPNNEEKEAFCAAAGLSPYTKIAQGRGEAVALNVDTGFRPPPDPV